VGGKVPSIALHVRALRLTEAAAGSESHEKSRGHHIKVE
jgi:hypothetical protein